MVVASAVFDYLPHRPERHVEQPPLVCIIRHAGPHRTPGMKLVTVHFQALGLQIDLSLYFNGYYIAPVIDHKIHLGAALVIGPITGLNAR